MQESEGEIIPPASVVAGPGWSWPSPAFWAGSGLEENIRLCWAEIGPIHFGLSPAQHLWGLVLPSLVGSAQPNLILYIMYIILLFVLFIYRCIYIYIYKRFLKYLKKYC
jgi:hypothetical protein